MSSLLQELKLSLIHTDCTSTAQDIVIDIAQTERQCLRNDHLFKPLRLFYPVTGGRTQ